MSKIRIKGDTSGHVDLETSATGSNLSIGGNTTVTGTAAITGPATISGPNNYEGLIVENTATDFAGGYMKIRDGNSTAGQYTWIGRNSDVTYVQSSNSNMAMQFTNAGIVTKENQPMFDAYLTANSTHSSGLYNLSTGDSWATRANVGNHFSSGTFTAPVDGKYLFTANITANGSVGAMAYFGCEFQVNGNRRYIHWWGKGGSTGSYFAANNSAIMSLAANDVVRLASEKAQSTTIVGGSGYTSFTGMLIG